MCLYPHSGDNRHPTSGGISKGYDAQQIALGLISYILRTIDFKVVEETPDWAIVLW